jgi:hypothetical protein
LYREYAKSSSSSFFRKKKCLETTTAFRPAKMASDGPKSFIQTPSTARTMLLVLLCELPLLNGAALRAGYGGEARDGNPSFIEYGLAKNA